MKKSEIAELVASHDSQGLLDALVFKEVRAGDAVFVPAGVVHAIEAGIFVLELQEPTDLSILLEWDGFAVDGDKDGHLDLGFDTALDALRLTPLSVNEESEILTKFEIKGKTSKKIFNQIADPFFRADFIAGDQNEFEAGFGIYLNLSSDGLIQFENSDEISLQRGDAVLIPYSAGASRFKNCTGILARPPAA
jgi:mannose-6-phosphate isomerase